jgi:hypothetical protein
MTTTNKTTTKKRKSTTNTSQTKIKKKAKLISDKTAGDQSPTKETIKESLKETKHNLLFQTQMNKVNDLIKDGNIRQAYSAIPDEGKFPKKYKVIKDLKTDLMNKIWNL